MENKFLESDEEYLAGLNEQDRLSAQYLKERDSDWRPAGRKNTPTVLRLLHQLKGERTWARLSEDTGVKKSILSRVYRSNEIRLTPKVIYDLTHDCAKDGEPRNGVTYERLLIASGSIPKEYLVDGILIEELPELDSKSHADDVRTYAERLNHEVERKRVQAANENIQEKFEKKALGTIVPRLSAISSSFIYETIDTSELSDRRLAKYAVRFRNEPGYFQEKWGFYFLPKLEGENPRGAARTALKRVIFSVKADEEAPDEFCVRRTAITIVTNSAEIFKAFEEYKDIRYLGDLNVLLINPDELEIKDVMVLARYDKKSGISNAVNEILMKFKEEDE